MGKLANGLLTKDSLSLIISESGLYKLVRRSNKPEAHEVQEWATRVVLPTLRKDEALRLNQIKLGETRDSPKSD